MIEIRKLQKEDMKLLWEYAFQSERPWMSFDAPFLDEHLPLSYEEFEASRLELYLDVDFRQGIFKDGRLIGLVSYYWESYKTRWLEFGIVIYDENEWGHGLGSSCAMFWMDQLFTAFPNIQRLGFSTWSGNKAMMGVGENIGMTLEGRIRSVRYYQGKYYDALKYGMLREEWDVKRRMF
ncbi:GNAT family protein [Erysipelothrix rhusiopathiae]|uniref:GNAT family N-acetyltransferase n=1 Tax=Erysipelothrix rhusiopathiae TaxID=1648 RepID=UPI000210B450|nr:GNAT family protein [Erysipelothrix rhusiopathiae]UPU39948.1 GNAT family N-acetyltransferase [Erysipelothrix sp. Poltava]AGN25322.1 N-acetyltransferase GCN5 [Erysipelothrix rhusiopathiae SY1027]AMS11668.1 GNAT family acetyltransferase [Erysipelothrix rhusiopathiae]AOO68167.1 GNAT family N-acetyltransferase [Erysipelothrix rhusiopathiae]AWU40985.1 N-acetyltransferase [Erysipelothrix rhusiopathiae]